jgi:hypothetical protein
MLAVSESRGLGIHLSIGRGTTGPWSSKLLISDTEKKQEFYCPAKRAYDLSPKEIYFYLAQTARLDVAKMD